MPLTSITSGLIGTSAVNTAAITDGAVTYTKLAPNAVTTSSISAGAVTSDKLSPVDPQKTNIFGNGVTTSFAVAGMGGNVNPNALIVFLDGVMQEPSQDYTIVGSNVVFYDAPLAGSRGVVIAPNAPFTYANTIPSDNSVSNAKIQDGAVTDSKVNLTNLALAGNLTVQGNLTAFGDLVYLDTMVSVTSALSVINVGTGPALVVQQKGVQPIAEFYDQDSGTALFVDNAGKTGLGTRTPNETLTVVGSISATGPVTYNRGTEPADIGLVIAFS